MCGAGWVMVLAVLGVSLVMAMGSGADSVRGIAIDERLARDAAIEVGDRVTISAAPDSGGATVRVDAITRTGADPSEISRREYRVRMHLDHLQTLADYGDRVDRFAVRTRSPAMTDSVLRVVNDVAFGFRGYRSADIAVETSSTFAVVSRFHRAIGVITVVASAIFLLCIMLLKVDERRRDVAALRLLGVSSATIVKSVVLEASFIALFGSAAGVGLGVLATTIINRYYQAVYETPMVFAMLSPGIIAFSIALSVVLGLGAGLFASLRLVRAHPLTLFGR